MKLKVLECTLMYEVKYLEWKYRIRNSFDFQIFCKWIYWLSCICWNLANVDSKAYIWELGLWYWFGHTLPPIESLVGSHVNTSVITFIIGKFNQSQMQNPTALKFKYTCLKHKSLDGPLRLTINLQMEGNTEM